MKINIPENITSEDLSSLSLGVFHNMKKSQVCDTELHNAVEHTLVQQSSDIFDTYFRCLTNSIVAIMEKS